MRNKVIAFLAAAVICLTTVSPAPVWAAEEPVRAVSAAGEQTEENIRSLSGTDDADQVDTDGISGEQEPGASAGDQSSAEFHKGCELCGHGTADSDGTGSL